MSRTASNVFDPPAGNTIPLRDLPGAAHLSTDMPADMPAAVSVRHDSPLIRRLNLFWLAVIIALLATGCVNATAAQPTLWHSWRGPAMILLALGFVGWYCLLHLMHRHDLGWPPPRRIFYAHLALGFVLIALLLPFSVSFADLLFALIGVSAGMLPFRESLLPVGIIVLVYIGANGLLSSGPRYPSVSTILGGLGNLAMAVGIIYALTALMRERFQREHIFHELSEAHRRLRLSAAREADLATLRERNRLAREMHDSLGHALVSISIKLEAVRFLYDVDAERAAAELDETTALVRSTMTDLRHSLAGLRPAALEEQPLSCALAEMAREMGRRTGVEATCSVDERTALLDREAQEALYRVGQEALTNVAKHAHAAHVALTLTLRGRWATLEVADDGVGLGAAQRDGAAHYGVLGLRERVEALGGTLTLGPRPEGGTMLRASVPAEEA